MYIGCATIEAGIFLSQIIWLYRTRAIRKRAHEARLTFEEFPEGQEWQSKGWQWGLKGRREAAFAAVEDGTEADFELAMCR